MPMERADLVGRWRLVEYVGRADDGSVSHPLGERVVGDLVYTAGGAMSGHIAAGDRPRFAGDDPWGAPVDERASAFASYIGYFGRYEIDGDAVTHHVTASSFPNWTGAEQLRYAESDGDRLVLRTAPMRVAGRVVVNELHWAREE